MLKQLSQKRRLFTAAVLLGLLFSQATANTTSTKKENPAVMKQDPMAEKWGIEVSSIRMTANNHMIDFRYRVLDAKKAETLFERETKPYLIDQASGKVLAVPNTAKVGPLRSSNKPKEGKIYWMFFGNSGVVKAGNKVTVVIGEFKAENLIVE